MSPSPPPGAARPAGHDERTQRARRRTDTWITRALAGAAAVVAAAAPAQPTGLRLVDALWCAALAALVTLAAGRARRWAAIWFTGLATAGSVGSWWAAAGAVGLVLALSGIATPTRSRALGAAAGALGTVALLRTPEVGPHGATALLGAVAVAPVLWSAYQHSSRAVRRRTRRAVVVGAGVLAVAALGVVVPALAAEPRLRSSAADARAGLDLLHDGDQAGATGRLRQAADGFASARGEMTGPWTWPARLVPVLAQHVEALATAATVGDDVAGTAAEAAAAAPYRDLQLEGGRIDVATVAAMRAPVAEVAAALERAGADVEAARSPWLVPPATAALDDLATEVAEALPEATLAAQALDVAPALLGAEGERRYLVLFTTPSESRFLGGFAGSFGILTADGGQLGFEPSVSTGTLRAGIGERSLDQFPEFQARYGRYNLVRHFQNVTVSPDLPSNAEVTRALYQQATGEDVDGVLVADPEALAALLELTGPVQVEGLPTLTAATAVPYLLHDQYLDFEGDTATRRDGLELASLAVFEALLGSSLPGPAQLGEVLGPVVAEGRLLFHPFDPAEAALFERLGMDGRFALEPGGDHLSLRTANANPSKVDWFLHRSLAYEADVDPASGVVEATATITLRNEAPGEGLPRYVIGNSRQEPLGTNTMYLSLYSPLTALGARVDGRPAGLEIQGELGSPVSSLLVSVPPGGQVVVEVDLRGQLDLRAGYRLSVLHQPLVHDDGLEVVVVPADPSWRVASAEGLQVAPDGSLASGGGQPATDQRYQVHFEP